MLVFNDALNDDFIKQWNDALKGRSLLRIWIPAGSNKFPQFLAWAVLRYFRPLVLLNNFFQHDGEAVNVREWILTC